MGRVGGSDSNSVNIDTGVYIQQGQIVDITDKSRNPMGEIDETCLFKSGKTIDQWFVVEIDMGDFKRKFQLISNYQIDKVTGAVTGISKYSKILNLMVEVLKEDRVVKAKNPVKLEDYSKMFFGADFMIVEKFRDMLLNRTVKFVTYPTGIYEGTAGKKSLNTDLFYFYNIDEDGLAIEKEWNASKNRLRNFNPEVVQEVYGKQVKKDNTSSFNYGENQTVVEEDDVI